MIYEHRMSFYFLFIMHAEIPPHIFGQCTYLACLFTSGWSNVNCTQTNTFYCTRIVFSSCQHTI